MAKFEVGYLVGSLAAKSINRRLARALVEVAPPELQMTEISFKDLPLYSYDYDRNYPPVATAFKDAIAAVDAVLFVTPEYNRSAVSCHRNVAWEDRHGGRAAAFAQHPGVLQLATDQIQLRRIFSSRTN